MKEIDMLPSTQNKLVTTVGIIILAAVIFLVCVLMVLLSGKGF